MTSTFERVLSVGTVANRMREKYAALIGRDVGTYILFEQFKSIDKLFLSAYITVGSRTLM